MWTEKQKELAYELEREIEELTIKINMYKKSQSNKDLAFPTAFKKLRKMEKLNELKRYK